MRKKGVGQVLRARAVDRDTWALQGDRRNECALRLSAC
jgi:hypothetical protein